MICTIISKLILESSFMLRPYNVQNFKNNGMEIFMNIFDLLIPDSRISEEMEMELVFQAIS